MPPANAQQSMAIQSNRQELLNRNLFGGPDATPPPSGATFQQVPGQGTQPLLQYSNPAPAVGQQGQHPPMGPQ